MQLTPKAFASRLAGRSDPYIYVTSILPLQFKFALASGG
jgi:hypothetical protein